MWSAVLLEAHYRLHVGGLGADRVVWAVTRDTSPNSLVCLCFRPLGSLDPERFILLFFVGTLEDVILKIQIHVSNNL